MTAVSENDVLLLLGLDGTDTDPAEEERRERRKRKKEKKARKKEKKRRKKARKRERELAAVASKRKGGKLPGRAVKILRDWLFSHVDDPYPSEFEKKELIRHTGLTLVQINNWFSNARRRTLKSHSFQRRQAGRWKNRQSPRTVQIKEEDDEEQEAVYSEEEEDNSRAAKRVKQDNEETTMVNAKLEGEDADDEVKAEESPALKPVKKSNDLD